MAYERVPNSYTQPSAPDTILAAAYTPGDGVLVVNDSLPNAVPYFRVRVGSTSYRVTDKGAGDVNWAIPDGAGDGTSDTGHVIGTAVYLEWTSAGMEAAFRSQSFVTVNDETQSHPASKQITATGTGRAARLFRAMHFR